MHNGNITTNFAKRKNQNTLPAARANLQPATITILAPAPDLDRAGRIGYFHALAHEAGKVSIMAALAAGIELHRAKDDCGHGSFGVWLKRNCDFSQSTAYKYMALAEQLAGARLAGLIEAAEPPAMEVLAEHAQPVEAKTLTQLYFDFGICRPGKMGGSRPGAGRPPADPDPYAKLTEALANANRLIGDLATWAIGDDGLGELPDDVLQACLAQLGDVVKRGREILEGRQVNNRFRRATK